MTPLLDDIDRAMCRALVADAGLSAAALGALVGLSQPAAWRRIRRLREAGVLAGTRLALDAQALGFGVTVFLGVKLATKGRVSLEDFERAVTAIKPPVSSLLNRNRSVPGRLSHAASTPALRPASSCADSVFSVPIQSVRLWSLSCVAGGRTSAMVSARSPTTG